MASWATCQEAAVKSVFAKQVRANSATINAWLTPLFALGTLFLFLKRAVADEVLTKMPCILDVPVLLTVFILCWYLRVQKHFCM